MKLFTSLLAVAAISAALLGLLTWFWTADFRYAPTGAVLMVVLLLLAAALAGEGKRRETDRQ